MGILREIDVMEHLHAYLEEGLKDIVYYGGAKGHRTIVENVDVHYVDPLVDSLPISMKCRSLLEKAGKMVGARVRSGEVDHQLIDVPKIYQLECCEDGARYLMVLYYNEKR